MRPRGGEDENGAVVPDEHALAYLPHPDLAYYQTWSYKYCEIDPGCCGFRVSSVVQPQQFAYYFVKPDHSNYNFRIAVHTVNDNLDLYTRRDDDGGGDRTPPTTTSPPCASPCPGRSTRTSTTFCASRATSSASVLGGGAATNVGAEDEYHTSLSQYMQNDERPTAKSGSSA